MGSKPTGNPMGRPPIPFDPDLGARLAEWFCEGKPLSRFIKLPDVSVSIMTIYRWMEERPDFAESLARARDEGVETLVDRMLHVIGELPQKPQNGQVRRAELEIKTIQWIASKMKPQKYGDSVNVNHSGTVSLALSDDAINAKIARYLRLAGEGSVPAPTPLSLTSAHPSALAGHSTLEGEYAPVPDSAQGGNEAVEAQGEAQAGDDGEAQ
jgi:hypothetical protein